MNNMPLEAISPSYLVISYCQWHQHGDCTNKWVGIDASDN